MISHYSQYCTLKALIKASKVKRVCILVAYRAIYLVELSSLFSSQVALNWDVIMGLGQSRTVLRLQKCISWK